MFNSPLTHAVSKKLDTESFESEYTSLEDKMIAAFAGGVEEYGLRKTHINDTVNFGSMTSPETNLALLKEISAYTVDLSLAGSLVRKATGAVETLLRA